MLQVRGIIKRFGDVLVLDRISFNFNRGDRVGLIGPNGCGKSTLLRILVGDLPPDQGSVRLSPPSLKLGYLPQALNFPPDATVGGVLHPDGTERDVIERQLARLAQDMAQSEGDKLDAALAGYDRVLNQYESLVRGNSQSGTDAVLAGLGMADVEQTRSVEALSGGQKTRLGLAHLLLLKPDLLLLDEPTNHLDIAGLTWLEEYLAEYPGAVMIVSHDRALLDCTVTRILALDDKTRTLRTFSGNYTEYAVAQDRELAKQWSTYREQQARIGRLQDSIRRLTGQAVSIEKGTTHFHYRRIAKDLARRATVMRRRLERELEGEGEAEKPKSSWEMRLNLDGAPRSGQDVLYVSGLSMGFEERALFEGINLRLRYSERAVLVGANGAGKTTLLRCIAGRYRPWKGEVRLGRGVCLGYLTQEQETLEPDATPLALVRAAAPLDETTARHFLHRFLFAGDDVLLPVGRLSFGERSRLMLALLAVQKCNFLLLDEPINHLDIPSRENFEEALARFEGTVLAVVHDRYFIDRFATTLWLMEDGRVSALQGLG